MTPGGPRKSRLAACASRVPARVCEWLCEAQGRVCSRVPQQGLPWPTPGCLGASSSRPVAVTAGGGTSPPGLRGPSPKFTSSTEASGSHWPQAWVCLRALQGKQRQLQMGTCPAVPGAQHKGAIATTLGRPVGRTLQLPMGPLHQTDPEGLTDPPLLPAGYSGHSGASLQAARTG